MSGPLLAVALVLCAALGGLGILLVLGAGKIARSDDIMAVADATHECAGCPERPRGPCTCTEPCGSIRCTAWDEAITPTPPRITSQDIARKAEREQGGEPA